MLHPAIEAQLLSLKEAESSEPWALKSEKVIAGLCSQVADSFCEYGDAVSTETAERMGVTPAEVWLEVIFPSVWGLLSTARALSKGGPTREPRALTEFALGRGKMAMGPASSRTSWCGDLLEGRFPKSAVGLPPVQLFAGYPVVQMLPRNQFESLLLPGFRGYVFLDNNASAVHRREAPPEVVSSHLPVPENPALALCLLPFNLASIGALDIVHLLCSRGLRVVAKISEKVEFVGSYLERLFAPFVQAKALLFLRGGPELGAELVTRPEFSHIHLTGSARTAANVEEVAGRRKVTCELGGVTPAIVFPDALSTRTQIRLTARQIAFGALANNGQHCVSYQVVLVPESQRKGFEQALWAEMMQAALRGGSNGCRQLIDSTAAQRLETLVEDAQTKGAQVIPSNPRAREKMFPVSLVSGMNQRMRLFCEEAFGPVVGLMGLPDAGFEQHALRIANGPELLGDLAASIFTSQSDGQQTRKMASELRHGMVTVNTYPGVAFATSLPWGAGPAGLSGRGWVHNYWCLPEANLQKVVLTAPLGRKGFGPLSWEDPWLLDVPGQPALDFARALVHLTRAYFNRSPLRFLGAQTRLMAALARREAIARWQDQKGRIH